MNEHYLIIFDIDGTIADRDTGKLLPGVYDWFEASGEFFQIAFATNQGGVGLRHWMEKDGFGEPEKFPTEKEVYEKVETIIEQLPEQFRDDVGEHVYFAFAYQSKKSGKWSPDPSPDVYERVQWSRSWRKPGTGMLHQAMADLDEKSEHTLMVGDRPEDEEAAKRAQVDFLWADDFFGRKTQDGQ